MGRVRGCFLAGLLGVLACSSPAAKDAPAPSCEAEACAPSVIASAGLNDEWSSYQSPARRRVWTGLSLSP